MDEEGRVLPFDRPPILLLGSGITRRYTEGSPDWRGLLIGIAARMGIDEASFLSFEAEAMERCDRALGHMPMLATVLSEHFRRMVMDGRGPREILDEEEMDTYLRTRADPIKIMAATEFSDLRPTEDPSKVSELELLRGLSDVIPCVITTNYDTLIEDAIFGGRFKVYSRVADYYFSGSQGVGEVFKIHGTCLDPSSMVLNQEDYLRLGRDSKIVTAKILSVLCDYPMLIMGYSLEDADVKGILDDLVSSLDDERLAQLERNIVYVSYLPGEDGFRQSTMTVENEGRRMSLKAIRTDNFAAIFREMAWMEPSLSPILIRKVRQLVKRITVTQTRTSSPCFLIGIDDIRDEDADRMAVAISLDDNLRVLEAIPLYTVDSMVRDILSGDSRFSPRAVVEYFRTAGPRMFKTNQYVPIFYFIRKSGYRLDTDSEFWRNLIDTKNEQFDQKLSIDVLDGRFSSVDGFSESLACVSRYKQPLAVMQCFDKGT